MKNSLLPFFVLLIVFASGCATSSDTSAPPLQPTIQANEQQEQQGEIPQSPANEEEQSNSDLLEGTGSHEITTQDVLYFENSTGFLATPAEQGDYPGVILVHEWWGLNQNIKDMAGELAKNGYSVLAVDLYGGKVAVTSDEAREYVSAVDQEKATANMKAAIAYLKENYSSTKTASLGWCFGGGQSMQLALSGQELDATMIYYGNLVTEPEELSKITWPILGVFGDLDQSIPVETVNEFDASLDGLGIENEIYVYDGVGHAFANPSGQNYAPEETMDAWEKTLAFLEKHLKTEPEDYGYQPAPLSNFRDSPEIPSEAELATLPECEEKFFSFFPTGLPEVTEITPIGNLGPPGHTFPTEHSFLHFQAGGTSTETFDLIAPADVFITSISQQFNITNDPQDSTVWFALCKDVIGYYNHVKELSSELEKIIEDSGCAGKPHVGPNSCLVKALEPVPAGTVLGKVGRLQGNFDFGLLDLRKEHVFANPSRYSTRSLYIQCPYDYYPDEMKQEFFELIERDDEKQCGVSAQDVLGTLKGNWFFEETTDSISQWNYYLAFVNDNENPQTQVVSIGGVITESGKLEFMPTSSGQVNREFEQVTPDGKIYCYESQNFEGKIIVQMENEAKIKIEYKQGNCSGSEAFTEPRIYER